MLPVFSFNIDSLLAFLYDKLCTKSPIVDIAGRIMYIIILTRFILMVIPMFRSLMEDTFIVTSRDASTGRTAPFTRWLLRLLAYRSQLCLTDT